MDFPRNLFEAEADVEDESWQSQGNTESEPTAAKLDHGLLIEAIQGYPYLFDLSSKLYKDTKRKTLAWQHIAELLNCDVEDCMKAWRNLRDRFVKERNKLASGAGAPETNWPFYESMLFYGKFSKTRKTHTSTKRTEGSRPPSSGGSRPSSSASAWSNITFDTIMSPEGIGESQASEDDGEAPVPSTSKAKADIASGRETRQDKPEQTPTTSSGPSKKRKRLLQTAEDDVSTIMGVAKTIMTKLETKAQKSVNSTFAEYIFAELEKLPEDEAKNKRKKILNVLFDD